MKRSRSFLSSSNHNQMYLAEVEPDNLSTVQLSVTWVILFYDRYQESKRVKGEMLQLEAETRSIYRGANEG